MCKRITTASIFLIVSSTIIGCASLNIPMRRNVLNYPVNLRELDSGWVCMNIGDLKSTGEELSTPSYPLSGWMRATVPGTVLTTLLNDSLIPDPYYGMNNKKIPDIYDAGRKYYTYWFANNFHEQPPVDNQRVWLHFRGINYGCDIYLNGHRLNKQTHYGMFLRQTYDITSFIPQDGDNRLAVLVFPPDPVGNPNGGQGGDGTIARNVSSQYTAGWDWIQPIHDRNTGIWDKVIIERTFSIRQQNPHVVTVVPGKRFPEAPQAPVIIKASAEIYNPTDKEVHGALEYILDSVVVKKEVVLQPDTTTMVQLPDYTMKNPKLWWPNGYGRQALYRFDFQFLNDDNQILDEKIITTGIREIQTQWNDHTRSRQVLVNGQKIFIKGGDWITSDAMLRFSPERYDAELRFHRDMNLNLIRVWGGGITERPEFYDACDKYGILVFQDFWMSGDCNGKWTDPKKKEDQWTRRNYPDDHLLFLESVADQVKMIRNHPSLAFYCGGNEIAPPEDILASIQDSLLPELDTTRYFFEYSNVDSMSYNFIGRTGDGPYWLEPVRFFWENRFFPFNSEIGSVGMGDYESLERFIPQQDMTLPGPAWKNMDSVWGYHEPGWYGSFIDAYGKPMDVKDYADKAQLVNYDEYRGLIEGHLAHMWDWYTGVIIWKTQNPWTALRGQMYDHYLDPNGGLYGLHHAGEPLHVMYNPIDGMTTVVNETFRPYHDIMLQATAYDIAGKDSLVMQVLIQMSPTSVQRIEPVKKILDTLFTAHGGFLSLRLLDTDRKMLSDNFYWLPDSTGNYTGLQQMPKANVSVTARVISPLKIEVTISDPAGGPVAFFNRISLVHSSTKKRILPVFYSDNYISILPGEAKTIFIDTKSDETMNGVVSIKGWNVEQGYYIVSSK
ncbi:MAG TPA: glycoside hydrolase family 2 TIM barrel-domain containing protein [Candidatus Acidoferrales bacterium]|nr:glycoside hydrolase family 2 TIM barrel-domain containing protein [Candidatus Acidoferrales bacterium]